GASAPPSALGGPPPPPPPFGFAATMSRASGFRNPTASSALSQKKRRPLFWNKLPANSVRNTVWSELSPAVLDIPLDEIDELFAIVNVPARSRMSDVPVMKAPKSLIDLNRAQNIAIILTRIKLPYPEIRKALLTMDEEVLTVEHLKALQACLPTSDELELVRDYAGDFSRLAAADQFFKAILGIPRLSQRLSCTLYARKFHVDLAEIKPDLRALRRAVEETRGSDKLKRILEVVLAVGNTLNTSTFRGDARGFAMTDLLKLRDTKPTIISAVTPTLLHYLVRLLNRMDHALVGFLDECPNVELAARLSTQSVTSAISGLMAGHKALKEELTFLKKVKASPSKDSFLASMESFYSLSSPQIKALGHAQRVIMTDLNELISYYGENPSQTKPEDFFAIVSNFGQALMRAEVDVLEAEREAEVVAQKKAKAAWLTQGLKDLEPAPEVRGPLVRSQSTSAASGQRADGLKRQASVPARPVAAVAPLEPTPASVAVAVPAPALEPAPAEVQLGNVVDAVGPAVGATGEGVVPASVGAEVQEAAPIGEGGAEGLPAEEMVGEIMLSVTAEEEEGELEAEANDNAEAEAGPSSGSSLRTPTQSTIRFAGTAISPTTSDIAEMSFEEGEEEGEEAPLSHERDSSTATVRPAPPVPTTDDGLPLGSGSLSPSMFRASYGRSRRGQGHGQVDEGSIRASLGPINSGRKSLKMNSNGGPGRDSNYRPLSRIFLTGDAAGSALYSKS
ncbi:hypothetical protein A4X03_0g6231, partial [Tilletia caries]